MINRSTPRFADVLVLPLRKVYGIPFKLSSSGRAVFSATLSPYTSDSQVVSATELEETCELDTGCPALTGLVRIIMDFLGSAKCAFDPKSRLGVLLGVCSFTDSPSIH